MGLTGNPSVKNQTGLLLCIPALLWVCSLKFKNTILF